MSSKISREEVYSALGLTSGDNLSFSQGVWTLRMEYYWRSNRSDQERWQGSIDKLRECGFTVVVVEYGDHYASFKGGASVKRNSNYFMRFKLSK
jgi:hypothetical protein